MIVTHHANADSIPFLEKATGGVGFVIASVKNFGWSGIDMFLVLSGFLMAHTFCQHFQRYGTIDVTSYYKARAKRIIPSYYFLLFVLALTAATHWLNIGETRSLLKDLLTHALFLNNYLDQLPNGPTWYVAAIAQVYLLIPLLLLIISSLRKGSMESLISSVAVVGIVIIPLLRCWAVFDGSHKPNDFMETHYRLDTVLEGMLAYCLMITNHPIVRQINDNPRTSLSLAALFIFPCVFISRIDPYMFTIGFSLLALGYSILILLLVQNEFAVPRVISAILLAVSTWSYNIYLWHTFVPKIIGQPYTDLQLFIDTAINSPGLQVIIQMLIFVIAGIVAGAIMTNLVEKPAAKWLS